MTSVIRDNYLRQLNHAYLASFITHKEYTQRCEAVHQAYYTATYGELDLSHIPA